MNFPARLRRLRRRDNLTQVAAAREAGISNSYLCQLESGACTPTAEVLRRLADCYGVTMDELWRGTTVELGKGCRL